jgi:hypothetical protein
VDDRDDGDADILRSETAMTDAQSLVLVAPERLVAHLPPPATVESAAS